MRRFFKTVKRSGGNRQRPERTKPLEPGLRRCGVCRGFMGVWLSAYCVSRREDAIRKNSVGTLLPTILPPVQMRSLAVFRIEGSQPC